MKLNRTYLFILISSLALLIVLIIQVNWILDAAKTKEILFSEKATLVLSKTAEALAADTVTRKKLEVCVGNNERKKVDSLFNHYMKLYNIQIAYYFDVKPGAPVSNKNTSVSLGFSPTPTEGCYQQCITEDSGTKGLELKLVFPDQEQFIMEEMGIPFISSVLLILVVGILFWRTAVSLMKEKELSEHTTDFLNNMTHEFKTPLTNIALAGKMMLKEPNIKQEEKIKHYSGIILEENEKLRQQVEQVLSMTALERGEIPLQKTELDLHQLIKDSLKCIGVQIENTQGEIRLDLKAENFVVMGDKTHITNALCNLVDNAIKYSGEKPELHIQTHNDGDKFVITISDKGIGIDSTYQDKVFEKFFRVPTGNVHDVKGFGLGLAYVKKIIELHGGSIHLQSEKGEGTTFTIALTYV